MSLRKNLAEAERDTEEAFESRRELVKLLVEKIVVRHNEEGRPKVEIIYRFGPSEARLREDSADGGRNSEELKMSHGRSGGGDLLRGHPRRSVHDVDVERGAAAER